MDIDLNVLRLLERLAGHPPAEVAGSLGKNVPTAPPRAAAPSTGPGVARTLLAVELAG